MAQNQSAWKGVVVNPQIENAIIWAVLIIAVSIVLVGTEHFTLVFFILVVAAGLSSTVMALAIRQQDDKANNYH